MLHRLYEKGLVRLDHYGGQGNIAITVTDLGEAVARDVKRAREGEPDDDVEEVDLDWERVARPVLDAAYRLWRGRGAAAGGVLTSTVVAALGDERARQSYRAIALLTDGGYLDKAGVLEHDDAPVAVTVTARGLQVVGGWPATTGEAAASALIAALEREIAETDEPERRGKLERLRDVAVDVGQGALAEVLKHMVTGGI